MREWNEEQFKRQVEKMAGEIIQNSPRKPTPKEGSRQSARDSLYRFLNLMNIQALIDNFPQFKTCLVEVRNKQFLPNETWWPCPGNLQTTPFPLHPHEIK